MKNMDAVKEWEKRLAQMDELEARLVDVNGTYGLEVPPNVLADELKAQYEKVKDQVPPALALMVLRTGMWLQRQYLLVELAQAREMALTMQLRNAGRMH
jgi:hypothetical protein